MATADDVVLVVAERMVLTPEVATLDATLSAVVLVIVLTIDAVVLEAVELDVVSNRIRLCAPTMSANVLPATIDARTAKRFAGVIPAAIL